MQVLHIAPHYGGGVGKVAFDLAKFLKKNYNVFSYFVSIDKPLNKIEQLLNDEAIGFEGGMFFTYAKYHPLILAADIVLIHYWNHPLLVYFLATFCFPPCNIVIWVHTSGLNEPNIVPDWLLDTRLQIVFSSSVSFRLIEGKGRKIYDNICAIHSVRDLSIFTASYQHRSYSSASRLIYVGTVSRQKMHEDSAYIFKKIADHPMDITIVGEVTDIALHAELSRHPRINIRGHQEDIVNALLVNDIFIYPLAPNHYGTGEQVILEAMATGMPVVCLNNPTESVIIKHGETGLLAECPDDFIKSVLTLSADLASCRQMGKASYNRIVDSFTISKAAEDFVNIFMKLGNKLDIKWSGKILNASPPDVPYSMMLLSSFANQEAYYLYIEGKYEESIYVAAQYCSSPVLNSTFLANPSKGSPLQYKRYFPYSRLLCRLCSMIEIS
jgi:glycosyltransferase involved in cell wall biosynthesis